VAVFEFETILYRGQDYWWQWNERNNLEGFGKASNQHIFTWQPHGSQFTILEDVAKERLAIRIKQPPIVNRNEILKAVEFDESWIEIIK